MKSQEIAFMVSLISANYRRRMVPCVLMCSLFFVSSVALTFNYEDSEIAYGLFLVILLTAALFYYRYGVVTFTDGESNLPWEIRERQLKVLKEFRNCGIELEGLKDLVLFREFFN